MKDVVSRSRGRIATEFGEVGQIRKGHISCFLGWTQIAVFGAISGGFYLTRNFLWVGGMLGIFDLEFGPKIDFFSVGP